MRRPSSWRVSSDYIGAGRYILDDERIVVGTEYGVQCIPRPGSGRGTAEGWKVDLGSRSIGLLRGPNDTVLAASVTGIFAISSDGDVKWGTHSFKEVVNEPVAFQDGFLLTTRSAIHWLKEWNGSEWRFEFAEVLGKSVQEIRLINLFEIDHHVVAGVVDYDSGIGRIVVLGKNGKRSWMSDPGPISDLFPSGRGTFVWSQTGYGKFETRMSRLDGHDVWQKDFAGIGTVLPDGSLGLIVGSNEAPEWDDWEYRQLSPAGKVEVALRGNGRTAVRPVCKKDGTIYFLGSVLPLDPSGSRADYTSFLAMPQEVRFQHLMGIKTQLPVYDVYLHRYTAGAAQLEIVDKVSGSYSFGDLQISGEDLVYCDGRDLVGIEA